MKKNTIRRLFGAALSFCMVFSSAGFSAFADELEEEETLIIEDFVTDFDDDGSDAENDGEDDASYGGDGAEDYNEDSQEAHDDSAVAGGGAEEHEVTVPARNIRLKMKQTNKIIIGETFQIKFGFSPLKSDDYVTYRNFHKSVVKVDENGLVTAVGYGKAKVQLETTGGRKKNVYFIVTDIFGNEGADAIKGDIEFIEFADNFAMLRAGKDFQAEPIFYPPGYYDDLTYSSSNPAVASVSASGKIKGLKAGSAVITATASNGVSGELSVTVYDDILRGIDVSKWQGDINWKTVSVSGVDFAMIRSSFGSEHTDECLDKNVKGCEKYGIPYGFYHYTYAKTAAEARQEAEFFINNIRKYSPEYPIVLDLEEEFYKKMSKNQVTEILTAFMDVIEENGYYAMLYNSPNFMKACFDIPKLEKYDIWIACWGGEERLNSLYDGRYGMWQYSSTGKVKGINGDVDLDYSYKDYAEIIRKNGLNNL